MATESLAPDGQITWTNLDGSYLDIDDDPDSPDANWADAIDTADNTIAHVSFPIPTGNPTTGANLQNFKIWVKKAGNEAKTPNVDVSLYENGALLALLTDGEPVTSSSGQLCSFAYWDAILLTNADGSLVECYIEGNKSGGAPPRATVSIGAVEWNVTYTPAGPTPNAYNKIFYTSEPPTPNAWNQVKQEAGTGWRKILYT